LCFGGVDEFYEGKFVQTKDRQLSGETNLKSFFRTIFRLINIEGYEIRYFKKYLAKITQHAPQTILDFGCGGGTAILPEFGRVVGVDISLASLLQAQSIYDEVYQIDGERLPFREASFDIVFSSHVFGHIPLRQKPAVISEIYRVLKPGGHVISSIECDCESIIYERAKKYPTLYSKCYIEPWGHYGLELPHANFQRFREAGFTPIIESADIHKGYIRPVTSYENLLQYKGKDPLLYGLGRFSHEIAKSPLLVRALNLLFGLAVPLAYLFTPSNHRDSAKALYRKPL
jgi:ubiquinone/menaquinone biosynthesis C-methylase UbiE